MSVTHATPAVQKFCELWKDSFLVFLGKLGVASASGSIIGQPAATASSFDSEKCIVARFTGGGALRGDLYLVADKAVAVSCAQLMKAEPADSSVPFAESHRDGFLEFLRQVASQVATHWREMSRNEMEIIHQRDGLPALESPLSAAIRLSGVKIPDLSLSLLLSQAICSTLEEPQEAVPAKESPGNSQQDTDAVVEPDTLEGRSDPSPVLSPENAPSNLDLLLDVELEATIRFGRHEMLLRDIFSLLPGIVVELDQLVNEPAELLIAGRLIARGEVVVVDGNFGLQVTEVASDRQRAEILQI